MFVEAGGLVQYNAVPFDARNCPSVPTVPFATSDLVATEVLLITVLTVELPSSIVDVLTVTLEPNDMLATETEVFESSALPGILRAIILSYSLLTIYWLIKAKVEVVLLLVDYLFEPASNQASV